jgi:uncharacterized membrane protein
MKKLPFYLYIFLMGIALAQAVYYFPMMPDPLASHFGMGGTADTWSPKSVFFLFEAIMFLLMVGVFIVMPWAFQKFKVRKINLPNREYWLAPERIETVYEYFRESFAWFGVVNLVFLTGIMQLVFQANLTPNPVLDNRTFMIFLIGYFVFVIIWVITFYRKFGKTE